METEDNELLIRAKWIMDDAITLEQAARKLEEYAKYLRELKDNGWELNSPVRDDYGFLEKEE